MTVPTVASLCAALGRHLVPAEGFTAPDTEVTAVHISELLDPDAYLSGGELLLTTGMALPENRMGCRRYVSRLRQAGISALALGLGPVHAAPPDVLVTACREAGLPLLTVPGPTPFLTISRAYWTARSRSTEQQLNDAVAAHRALVDAAVARDPAAAILRRLARLLDGWAALLEPGGDLEQVFPVAFRHEGEALRAEVARLEVAGVHSSASFAIGDHVVVLFPLAVEDRIVGYLAAGSPNRVEPTQRRVVLTAAALLSLETQRSRRSESAREATRRCVALLVDLGHADAARRLAAEAGSPVPGQQVSVLAVRGRDSEDLARAVEKSCPDAIAVGLDRSSAWFLLPDHVGDVDELVRRLRASDRAVAAVLSEPVDAALASRARARAQRTLAEVSAGEVVLPRAVRAEGVAGAVDGFLAAATPELRDALVAYLRHRGQWEQAARALELHRNTLRYRVGRAVDALGLDLDDPDLAAEAWLALRARGVA